MAVTSCSLVGAWPGMGVEAGGSGRDITATYISDGYDTDGVYHAELVGTVQTSVRGTAPYHPFIGNDCLLYRLPYRGSEDAVLYPASFSWLIHAEGSDPWVEGAPSVLLDMGNAVQQFKNDFSSSSLSVGVMQLNTGRRAPTPCVTAPFVTQGSLTAVDALVGAMGIGEAYHDFYLLVTYDSATQVLRLYVDGVKYYEATSVVTVSPASGDIYFGAARYLGWAFQGTIHGVWLYNGAVTETEAVWLSENAYTLSGGDPRGTGSKFEGANAQQYAPVGQGVSESYDRIIPLADQHVEVRPTAHGTVSGEGAGSLYYYTATSAPHQDTVRLSSVANPNFYGDLAQQSARPLSLAAARVKVGGNTVQLQVTNPDGVPDLRYASYSLAGNCGSVNATTGLFTSDVETAGFAVASVESTSNSGFSTQAVVRVLPMPVVDPDYGVTERSGHHVISVNNGSGSGFIISNQVSDGFYGYLMDDLDLSLVSGPDGTSVAWQSEGDRQHITVTTGSTGGVAVLRVRSASDASITADVEFYVLPSVLTVIPAAPHVGTSQYVAFRIAETYLTDLEWSVQSGYGTIDADTGMYQAPAAVSAPTAKLPTSAVLTGGSFTGLDNLSAADGLVASTLENGSGFQAGFTGYGSLDPMDPIVGVLIEVRWGVFGGTASMPSGSVDLGGTGNALDAQDLPVGALAVTSWGGSTNLLGIVGANIWALQSNGASVSLAFSLSEGAEVRVDYVRLTIYTGTNYAQVQVYSPLAMAYGSANVTVEDPGPSITIDPTEVSLRVDETQSFSATVTGVTPTTKTWAVVGGHGSIDGVGLFTAESVGTTVVRAESTAVPGLCADAAVEVLAPLGTLEVAADDGEGHLDPGPVTVETGQFVLLRATLTGDLDVEPALEPSVTWSVVSGDGELDLTGADPTRLTGVKLTAATGSTVVRAASVTRPATYDDFELIGEDPVTGTIAIEVLASYNPVTWTTDPPDWYTYTGRHVRAVLTGNLQSEDPARVVWSSSKEADGDYFFASGEAQFPNPRNMICYTWSDGLRTIRVTSTIDPTKYAELEINSVFVFDITPHEVTLAPGQAFQFNLVEGTRVAPEGVHWSVLEPGGGTVAGGCYTAPATPGVYTVRAEAIPDGEVYLRHADAVVTVTNDLLTLEWQDPETLVWHPNTEEPTINVGTELLFRAHVLQGLDEVWWSRSGVGSIMQWGVFVAGAVAGDAVVTAAAVEYPLLQQSCLVHVVGQLPSIVVVPGFVVVGLGSSTNFTAEVVGVDPGDVVWYLMNGGVEPGTLEGTELAAVYQAPEAPLEVVVVAQDSTNPTIRGYAWVWVRGGSDIGDGGEGGRGPGDLGPFQVTVDPNPGWVATLGTLTLTTLERWTDLTWVISCEGFESQTGAGQTIEFEAPAQESVWQVEAIKDTGEKGYGTIYVSAAPPPTATGLKNISGEVRKVNSGDGERMIQLLAGEIKSYEDEPDLADPTVVGGQVEDGLLLPQEPDEVE